MCCNTKVLPKQLPTATVSKFINPVNRAYLELYFAPPVSFFQINFHPLIYISMLNCSGKHFLKRKQYFKRFDLFYSCSCLRSMKHVSNEREPKWKEVNWIFYSLQVLKPKYICLLLSDLKVLVQMFSCSVELKEHPLYMWIGIKKQWTQIHTKHHGSLST